MVQDEMIRETNPLLRRMDNILAEPAFDELLDLALDTCLTSRGRYEKNLHQLEETQAHGADTGEAELVQKLGLWGVRTALEVVHSPLSFFYDRPSEPFASEEQAKSFESFLQPTSPIVKPELFNGPINPAIARKIEAFGKSVLDEAFICLGEDAYDKVQAWHSATTPEEKAAVLNWLAYRVEDITPLPDVADDDTDTPELPTAEQDEPFYHPARLSPKLIGQFPDISTEPTCLSRSILAAAFFEKAGIPYMHGGVVESVTQGSRFGLYFTIDEVIQLVRQEWQMELPDRIAQKLERAKTEIHELIFNDNGFHAALVAKVDDEKWSLVDINYNINVLLDSLQSEIYTQAYEESRTLQAVCPGLERVVAGTASVAELPLNLLRDSMAKGSSVQEIASYLEDVSNTASLFSFQEVFISPFFSDESGKRAPQINKLISDCLEGTTEEGFDGVRRMIAKDVLLKYVFRDAKDGDIAPCLQRCKTDVQYRLRRAEDLKLAPALYTISLATVLNDGLVKNHIPAAHALMEVGLPWYRVGAAVLSDFAVYCGDELPLSFWLTYWPSRVSLTEHIRTAEMPHQRAAAFNHAHVDQMTILQYIRNHAIIFEFLEQENNTDTSSEGGE